MTFGQKIACTKIKPVLPGPGYGYTHSLALCHGARPKLIEPSSPYVMGIRDTESVREFQGRLAGARRVLIVGNGGIATEMVYELEAVDVVWAVKDDAITANFVDAGAAQFFSERISRLVFAAVVFKYFLTGLSFYF